MDLPCCLRREFNGTPPSDKVVRVAPSKGRLILPTWSDVLIFE
jgi:hypothetical protein